MDYEKAYKEALERAKKWRNAPNVEKIPTYANRVIEELFPELKESEDEKIRKELIRAFQSLNTIEVWNGIKRADIIAWLEKQDEKIPVVNFRAEDWYVSKVDGKIYNAKFMENPSANLSRKLEIEKAAFSAAGIIEHEEWFIKGAEWADENPSCVQTKKQGEQNPYSGVSFSYNGNIWGMCARDNGVDILFNKKLIQHICGEKQDEQKPIIEMKSPEESLGVSSKEYSEIVNDCLYGESKSADKIEPFDEFAGLTDFERTLADICIGWIGKEPGWKEYIKDNADVLLKIAVEKFNSVQDAPFEPKTEWSEEDERNLNWVINVWNRLRRGGDAQTTPSQMEYLENWLKSIKQRIGE